MYTNEPVSIVGIRNFPPTAEACVDFPDNGKPTRTIIFISIAVSRKAINILRIILFEIITRNTSIEIIFF